MCLIKTGTFLGVINCYERPVHPLNDLILSYSLQYLYQQLHAVLPQKVHLLKEVRRREISRQGLSAPGES